MDKITEEMNHRILNWLNGKPSPPVKIEYELTNRCNLNCLSCKAMKNFELSPYIPENEISSKRAIELIRNVAKLDVKIIKLTGGGEPLEKNSVIEIMEEIKSENIKGELNTNGTLLNKEMINKLVDIGWDTVIISLDAPDAETNDILRQRRGSFGKVVENIKKIQRTKKEFNKELPRIEIATVWSKGNSEKLNEMVEVCKFLNVGGFILQPLRIKDHKYDGFLLIQDKQKAKNNLEMARIRLDNSGIDNNLSDIDIQISNKNSQEILDLKKNDRNDPLTRIDCLSPFVDVKIYPNGDVGPCQNGGREPNKDMKSLKSSKLKGIWYSDYFNKIRKESILGKLKEKENFCKSCCGVSIYSNEFKKWLKENNLRIDEKKIKNFW
ncbi:MAG: radical SAM/SPASM domain-containing protein [Candidatus Aenigmatarchaeota archaeon]